MLCEKGIISKADFDKIEVGLVEIENQIAQGRFQFDINDEDIHMAIEKTLIKDVGVAGAGFLALAVMIFGQWKPIRIALAALLFGLFRRLR